MTHGCENSLTKAEYAALGGPRTLSILDSNEKCILLRSTRRKAAINSHSHETEERKTIQATAAWIFT
jgi:hypothetical protein